MARVGRFKKESFMTSLGLLYWEFFDFFLLTSLVLLVLQDFVSNPKG